MGHIRILECAAPWISGSVSKTVNLPKDCTVEDIEHVYVEAWKRGIKCVAVFRDGCKTFQPVVTSERQRDEQNAGGKASSAEVDRMRKQIEALRSEVESHAEMVKRPVRERLPEERLAANIKFQVADLEGYLTVGEYPDGRPGEIFIRTSKQGSTLSGIMDGFAIAVSLGLQYGVPLSSYVKKFMGMRFEPAGITNNADVRVATSILDHLFRRMAIKYLPMEERTELGVLTREEKIGLASGGHTNTIPVVDLVAASVAPALKAPEMTGDLSTCCGAPLTPVGTCKICSVCFTSTGCS
jgi:ribonucleoside-diphosphate reductase alpha chain